MSVCAFGGRRNDKEGWWWKCQCTQRAMRAMGDLCEEPASPTTAKKHGGRQFGRCSICTGPRDRTDWKCCQCCECMCKNHTVKTIQIKGDNCQKQSDKFHSHFCSKLYCLVLKTFTYFTLYSCMRNEKLEQEKFFVFNWNLGTKMLRKQLKEVCVQHIRHVQHLSSTVKVGSLFFPLSNSFIHKQSLPHQALTSGRVEKEKKGEKKERERERRRRICGGVGVGYVEEEEEKNGNMNLKYSKICINCNGITKSVNTGYSKMNLFLKSGFYHSVKEIFTLLGCYTAYIGS